ncbi:MAG TPA: tetratricopeptide repeat protein [Acidobacteriota bacterium]|nr:tetratricopeptide repeat protein [Acidobacteriota bacterium]
MFKAATPCARFCILISLAAAGCGIRIPHVEKATVPPESLAKANTVAREGDIAMARGETYAALIKYLDAAKLNPNSEVIFNKVAITYTKLGYYDKAHDAIVRSLALSHGYAFGFNTLGTIQLVEKKPGAAIKSFRRAISLNSDVPFFYLNLGNAYLEKKQDVKAMQAFRQALALDPQVFSRQAGIGVQSASVQFNDSTRNYFLARVYAERGQDELALDFLKKALASGFTDFEKLKKDKEFEKLRNTKAFKELLEEYGVSLSPS